MKVEFGRPAAHAKLVDFALLGIVGLLVLLVIGLTAVLGFFRGPIDDVADRLGIDAYVSFLFQDGVQLVLVAALVLGLYRFVPARKLRTRDALAGAILTSRPHVGSDGAARDPVRGLLPLQPHLRVAGRRHDVPLLRLRRRAHLPARRRVRVRVVAAPGPPGPPVRTRIVGFVRGLFVHPTVERPAERRQRRTALLDRKTQRQRRTWRTASASRPRVSETMAVSVCGPRRARAVFHVYR